MHSNCYLHQDRVIETERGGQYYPIELYAYLDILDVPQFYKSLHCLDWLIIRLIAEKGT